MSGIVEDQPERVLQTLYELDARLWGFALIKVIATLYSPGYWRDLDTFFDELKDGVIRHL